MIPYMGGKSQIAKWVISHFPQDYQKMCYVEVFGGAGWVLIGKEPSHCEVYNDKNDHLVALYEAVRDYGSEFQRRVEWTLHSRTMFQRALEKIKQGLYLDDIDHGLQYAITQVLSFSGAGTSYGYSKTGKGRWQSFYKKLETLRDRLMPIQIECLDFLDCIKRYDSPNTLFYLDPPYVDAEHYYTVPFGNNDHILLSNTLKNIQGKFVLSYYPHELVDKLYGNFKTVSRQTVKSSCGVTRNSKTTERPRATELLIVNF